MKHPGSHLRYMQSFACRGAYRCRLHTDLWREGYPHTASRPSRPPSQQPSRPRRPSCLRVGSPPAMASISPAVQTPRRCARWNTGSATDAGSMRPVIREPADAAWSLDLNSLRAKPAWKSARQQPVLTVCQHSPAKKSADVSRGQSRSSLSLPEIGRLLLFLML